jgi:hypothetical protein
MFYNRDTSSEPSHNDSRHGWTRESLDKYVADTRVTRRYVNGELASTTTRYYLTELGQSALTGRVVDMARIKKRKWARKRRDLLRALKLWH